MKKRYLSLALVFVMTFALFSGCGGEDKTETAKVDEKPVTLTIAGSWTDCKALDAIAGDFNKLYPNCTVSYEYLQDYYASAAKRMTGDDQIDLFFTTNIQSDSDMLSYALDLKSSEELDLSNTFDGLIENFLFREESGGDPTKLYAIPLGAEMRGLYINKTLLDSLSIAVPTNQKDLLNACKALKKKGYIPFHGNPGAFGQTLIYPWMCNLIANADDPKAAFEKIDSRATGSSELFRAPYQFIYTLVENGYYDYKKAQTDLNLFNETTDEDYARDFLNITKTGEEYTKKDDIGQVAFMPSPMSLKSTIDKTKDDYHSNIEYIFAPAPVSDNGGFAYLSPAHGIAANKNSANKDMVIKFLNFLFKPENNKKFAETFNVIPNTKEAFSYIKDLYDIPNESISHLGQVTFSYGFYDSIMDSLVNISKANNPKYMKDDGKGNVSLYPLDYYMDELEKGITGK